MKGVITIDGPSGAGKGTVSKILAKRLGYQYLDTGALYRAVAWKAREENIDPDNEPALAALLKEIDISFEGGRICVDGTDVTSAIRTAEMGELSSRISALPAVRAGLFAFQRAMCLEGGVVIEGRDTGTAVFPEGKNKFYLDATLEERARRRYEELMARDPEATLEKTMDDIKKRDARDSSRDSAPLMKTEDMIYIDSTDLSVKEVVKKILNHLT
ncbi:MAG: (d)CMP kinase [Nitrospiraceae bacterium]|nr:MAG: (d)CMP kinase [Nitrospiraceae bacterium]